MRALLLIALSFIASTATAQNMWRMNAAYQNQINTAQASAWAPYYAPVYAAPRPYYSRPAYGRRYFADFDRQQALYEAQNQTRELRQMNRTLQFMEWDLQDAARRR